MKPILIQALTLAIFVSFIIVLGGTTGVWAAEACIPETLPNNGKVCFYEGEGVLKTNVLYFFHGVSGNQNDWQTKTIPLALREEWKRLNLGKPRVLSISFGGFWLATPSGNFGLRGKLDSLPLAQLQELEKRLKISGVQEHWIYGDSMGGHNVWQLALRNPEYFQKVATTCSAQMSISPFHLSRFKSYASESGGTVFWISTASVLFRSFYKDDKIWDIESPLAVLKQFIPLPETKYLVMNVSDDVYGFTLPNKIIYQTLHEKGAQVQYFEDQAKHCLPNAVPLAEFFAGTLNTGF